MAPQARRTFERLQAILARADARFDNVVKQLTYVTDIDAYNASGRAERNKFFGARPASTGLVVRRLADPAMLIEVELVVDLGGSGAGKPLLDKYNVENHGGDFYQGVIVNGGRLLYLAGQVSNNPDGSVAGVNDWRPSGGEGLREHRPRAARRGRDAGERGEGNHVGPEYRFLAPGRRTGAPRVLQG
jgi:enamine deaminase RidA (YjgF/YER057c/UK114 family)